MTCPILTSKSAATQRAIVTARNRMHINQDVEPHGGINLQGFSASLTDEFKEPKYVIRLVKYGGQPHYLGTNNLCDIQTWIDAINKAATDANQVSSRCERSKFEFEMKHMIMSASERPLTNVTYRTCQPANTK